MSWRSRERGCRRPGRSSALPNPGCIRRLIYRRRSSKHAAARRALVFLMDCPARTLTCFRSDSMRRMKWTCWAVLLGAQPIALDSELNAEAPIPPVPPEVPVGMPSELLRRRPDVMRAERILAAATAEQGIAPSDFFPPLILGGTAGVQSQHAD